MLRAATLLLLSACCSAHGASERDSVSNEAVAESVSPAEAAAPADTSGCPPGEVGLEIVPVIVLRHASDVPPPPPEDGFTIEVAGEEPRAGVELGKGATFCVKPGNVKVAVRAEGYATVENEVGAPGKRRFVVSRAIAPGAAPDFGPGRSLEANP